MSPTLAPRAHRRLVRGFLAGLLVLGFAAVSLPTAQPAPAAPAPTPTPTPSAHIDWQDLPAAPADDSGAPVPVPVLPVAPSAPADNSGAPPAPPTLSGVPLLPLEPSVPAAPPLDTVPSLLAPAGDQLYGSPDGGDQPQAPPRGAPKPPPPAPPWGHVVVRRGDTLTSIARQNKTTIDALVTVNGLAARDRILIGQVLYIPPAGWTAPWTASATDSTPWPISLPAVPPPVTTYTVRPGDTVLGIAARFGVTVDAVVAANRLAARNYIQAGQVLSIPNAAGSVAPVVPAAPALTMKTYTIQPGDNLSAIAARFGTTPATLAGTNGLVNQNRILAGQTLVVPVAASAPPAAVLPGGASPEGGASAPPPVVAQPAQYTVRAGDALSLIAAQFGTTVDAMVKANKLTSANQIVAGQVLLIPTAAGTTPPAPSGPIPPVAAGGERPITSPPSIGPAAIDAVLASYHSPAAGTGTTFYALGVQYGIDPAYALAFFIHESSAGTQGVAAVTHSIGNIRTSPGYTDYQGYRSYQTWEAGIADWYSLIRTQYVDGWGLSTVSQIVPRYAPPTENDVAAYIADVQRLVGGWAGPFAQLPAASAGLRANLLPTAYQVTSEFGHYPWGGAHYGLDLAVPLGTGVTAPVGGVVVEVETHCVAGNPACGNGWGNHVWWRSAVTGHYILVAHFTTLNPILAPGVAVEAGTLLGFSGTTGFSTGPHVHIQASATGPSNAGAFDPSLELPWEACGHAGPHLGDAWGSTVGCQ